MTKLHFLLIYQISLALPLLAAERRLSFETDMEVYSLTFDDSKISGGTLRELSWLSPYMPVEIPSPYTSGTSETKEYVDKVLVPADLETCITKDPAYQGCSNDQPGTRMFFRNAQVNIAKSEAELQHLKNLKVPHELIPVKKYLEEKFWDYLSVEKARLAYYRSWNVAPLIHATKAICGRDADLSIVHRLSGQDHDVRYRLTKYDWHNQVNNCILKAGTYPIQSWKAFLSDYGIQEKRRFKRVE
jgi:hypothetical protein